jgi:hypothetical protein
LPSSCCLRPLVGDAPSAWRCLLAAFDTGITLNIRQYGRAPNPRMEGPPSHERAEGQSAMRSSLQSKSRRKLTDRFWGRLLCLLLTVASPVTCQALEPPRPRIEAVRSVDMSSSNGWSEFAALFRDTRQAAIDHDRAKAELKALLPEDAREASGHGVRARRSKSGAISFDLLGGEAGRAALQQ